MPSTPSEIWRNKLDSCVSHKDEAKEAENFHQRLEKGEVIDEGLALKSSLTNDSWQDLNRRYTPLPTHPTPFHSTKNTHS